MATVAAALDAAAVRLGAAAVDVARRDARLLLEAALGCAPAAFLAHPERVLGAGEADRFAHFVERRARREPASRILGRREFWGLAFAVTPDTFDPRPDSESVVEAVLERTPDREAPLRLLDLGTGTGCLLLALLSELPRAAGMGIDASPAAVAVAEANAASLGLAQRVRFRTGDWGTGLMEPFDWIVCNPPYVPTAAIARLAPEVSLYDPALALDGGPDGLDAYRALAPQLARLAGPRGEVALEIGADRAVRAVLAAAGLEVRAARPDLAGTTRCLVAGRAAG